MHTTAIMLRMSVILLVHFARGIQPNTPNSRPFPARTFTHTQSHENASAITVGNRQVFRPFVFLNTIRGGAEEVATVASKQERIGPLSTYKVSVCTEQGGRSYMEDEYYISNGGNFAAVFDGHGGQAVSRYLRQNLYANLQAALPSVTRSSSSSCSSSKSLDLDTKDSENAVTTPVWKDCEKAFTQAFEKVDREVQAISHWSFQGSTAVAVLLVEEKRTNAVAGGKATPTPTGTPQQRTTTTTVLAANVGDSRAVLSRAGAAVDLTRDHKPNDPFERARVEQLGGKVIWCGLVDSNGRPVPHGGAYRINGNLALSRAIGDRSERPLVSAEPEISTHSIDESCDEFIILGSDGLWDVMSSQDAVNFIHSKLDGNNLETLSESISKQKLIRKEMAALLTAEALRLRTTDNVTVVIIWLDDVEAS